LLSHYNGVPQSLIDAIIQSNSTRKDFLIDKILSLRIKTIGIYRLTMKEGSDNFRESAILDLIPRLKENKIKIILYEPMINSSVYEGIPLQSNLEDFIDDSDMIIANRLSNEIKKYQDKVFTRDLFHRDT